MHTIRVSIFIGLQAAVLLPAQITQVTGRVSDPADASVPKAKIEIAARAAGVTRSAETSSDGSYSTELPGGTYTITASAEGFKRLEKTDVRLDAGQKTTVDFRLELGSNRETVTVSDTKVGINITDAAVSTTIGRQQFEDAPLSGHSLNALIEMTPGVVIAATNANDMWGQFSINGQRPNANYYTIDGVSANFSSTTSNGPYGSSGGEFPATDATGGTIGMASVEALQEFRILTSSYAPEFGRQPGGQIQMTTRSGTNSFHGVLYEYLRNDLFDAENWFSDSLAQRKPEVRHNDFGGTFSGRIVKDRTFFFLSHETLLATLGISGITEVPTLATRAATNPALRPFLDAFPMPNGQPMSSTTAQFISTWPNYFTVHSTSIKLDHKLTDKINLFGRLGLSPSNNKVRDAGRLMSPGISTYDSITATFGATIIHSPEMNSDIRLNWSRSHDSNIWPYEPFGGATAPPASFVPTTPRGFGVFQYNTSWYNTGPFTDNYQRQINAVGQTSLIHMNHTFKFGVDYRYLYPTNSGFDLYESTYFPSGDLSILQTGIPPGGIYIEGGLPRATESWNFSLFAQDTWRVTRRLSLTYGVRWDLNPPETNRDDKPVLALESAQNPAQMVPAPPGTAYFKTTWTNFAPRAGLAWTITNDQKTVLRTGFGLFYDLTAGGTGVGFLPWDPPYTQSYSLTGVPYPSSDPRLNQIPGPPPYPYSDIWTADPKLKSPYSLQWNVSLERELPDGDTLSASYVGSAGRRLLSQDTLVNPNQYFNYLFLTRNGAVSDYDALQIQYRKRLGHGLQGIASYSWSHSTDTNSQDTGFYYPSSLVQDVGNRKGNSDFDVRHSFNASFNYDIPRAGSGWLARVTEGWSLSPLFRARTATPINVTVYQAIGQGGASYFRPDLVYGQPVYISDPNVGGGKRLNPAAFSIPTGRQGTLGRNAIEGFPLWQADLSLHRQFRITERTTLQFRIDSFNIFNHPNFGNPYSYFPSPQFGISQGMFGTTSGGGISGTGTGGTNPLYQIGGPRSTQISLRLAF